MSSSPASPALLLVLTVQRLGSAVSAQIANPNNGNTRSFIRNAFTWQEAQRAGLRQYLRR